MNIEIKEENHKLYVSVTYEPRKRDEKRESCDTNKIVQWLRENNKEYDIAEVVKEPARRIHNSMQAVNLQGEWEFDLVKPKPVVKPTPLSTKIKPKKKRTTQKNIKSSSSTYVSKTKNLEE